jgi:hypothetical protein
MAWGEPERSAGVHSGGHFLQCRQNDRTEKVPLGAANYFNFPADFSAEVRHHMEKKTMPDVVKSVREALQDFIAPELREQRAEIKSLGTEIKAAESKLSVRIDSMEAKMDAGFQAVDARFGIVDAKSTALKTEMTAGFQAVDAKFAAMRTEMAAGFQSLKDSLENAVLRGEVSTTKELADLRIRVQRLEDRMESQARLQQ